MVHEISMQVVRNGKAQEVGISGRVEGGQVVSFAANIPLTPEEIVFLCSVLVQDAEAINEQAEFEAWQARGC